MNSVLAGFVSGVGGAGGKYQEIQDEQRKYNLQQKEADAKAKRDEHFKRLGHSLEDSGMVGSKGEKLSREQVALAGPDAGMESGSERDIKLRHELGKEERADVRKDQLVDAFDPETETQLTRGEMEQRKKEGKPFVSKSKLSEASKIRGEERKESRTFSNEVDPKTGRRLTEAEAAKAVESGGETMPYEVWKNQEKERVQQLKDDKAVQKDWKKNVLKIDPLLGQPEIVQLANLASIYDNDRVLQKDPSMMKLTEAKETAKLIMAKSETMSADKAIAHYRKKNKKQTVDNAIELLKSQGDIDPGWWGFNFNK